MKALRFAALPGAEKVVFERSFASQEGAPTTRYDLRSIDRTGRVIGDDRDYDLLKVAMQPLERLAEAETHKELKVALNLKSGLLMRE